MLTASQAKCSGKKVLWLSFYFCCRDAKLQSNVSVHYLCAREAHQYPPPPLDAPASPPPLCQMWSASRCDDSENPNPQTLSLLHSTQLQGSCRARSVKHGPFNSRQFEAALCGKSYNMILLMSGGPLCMHAAVLNSAMKIVCYLDLLQHLHHVGLLLEPAYHILDRVDAFYQVLMLR